MRRRKWILTAVAAAMAAIACDAADVKDGAVQLRYDDSFQSWKLDIRVSAWDAQPGDTVTLEVAGQADVPLLAKHPEDWNSVQLVAWGERLYDERGRYRQQTNQFMSGFLTVSGIPVENTQYTPLVSLPGAVFTSPIEAHVDTGWDPRHAKRKLPISAAIPLVIPSDAPIGLYRTHVALLAEEKSTGRFLMLVDAAQATSARHKHPDILSFDATDALKMKSAVYHERFLPPIRIGDPDPPHMPVTLFADQVIMGQKGVLSEEDASSFGLSQRVRLSSDFVIPPDRYRLAMSPVPYFPRAAVPESSHGAVTVSSSLPHFIDFSTAQFRCELEDPDGRTTVCGMGAIAGVDDGILQTAEPAELDLENFGRYQVRIAGTVRDRTGHEYEFGGTYKFWVALPLSFSTASKTGSSFHVGSVFPTKVQIHPLVPAYVTLCVRHYPQSDPARVREKTFEGYANHFGYFLPTGRKPLVFDEPGEYVAEILAAYRQENGTLWIGSQKAAGVVAEDNPSVTVHGARIDLYPQKYKDVVVHLPTRGIAPDEASNGMTRYIDVSDCKDLTPPFWSGDILATPTGLDNSNNIMALMAQDVHDSALLRTEEERWSRFVEEGREPDGTTADAVTLPGVIAVFHGADGERPGQWPILSSHRRGYSPYDFPEGASLINYTYFTAIRPGFPAFTMVTDSTPFHAYWNPSPNGFGGQINAGPTGDLPQDMYRIDAGLVYRDLESGRNSYAAYTATVVIDPTETYARGITRVGERPLFSVAGVDYDLFLALEAAAILEPGELMVLATMVSPSVPAEVTMEFERPDGTQLVLEGRANSQGIFKQPESVQILDEPGVYTLRAHARYGKATGGVLSVNNGDIYHFVADPDRERFLSLEMTPDGRVDPLGTLTIHADLSETLTDARVTWSVMCPGIIMDAGREPLDSRQFTYHFRPAQFAAQFQHFQVVDYATGNPALAKSVFIVIFVEGVNERGDKVHDVDYVMIRGDRIYRLPTDLPRTPESKAVLELENAVAPAPIVAHAK